MSNKGALKLAILVLAISMLSALYLVGTRYVGSGLSLSAEEQAWIQANNEKLTVGGDPDYAPVDYDNVHGVHSGMSEDMLKLVESRTGLKIRRGVFPNQKHGGSAR